MMNRVFGRIPKPFRSGCVMVRVSVDCTAGLKITPGELVEERLLSKVTEKFVPV